VCHPMCVQVDWAVRHVDAIPYTTTTGVLLDVSFGGAISHFTHASGGVSRVDHARHHAQRRHALACLRIPGLTPDIRVMLNAFLA
jgi:hypothetical protein